MAFEADVLRNLYGRRDGGAYLCSTVGLAVVLSEADPADLGVQRSDRHS